MDRSRRLWRLTLDGCALALLNPQHESQHDLFLLRLLAVLLIIAGSP
jgi:hypothetical protein